ncbi:MAG: hypothetical protein PVJ46_03125 [Methyloceanibacter sp.]|jgi:hypothetical protein
MSRALRKAVECSDKHALIQAKPITLELERSWESIAYTMLVASRSVSAALIGVVLLVASSTPVHANEELYNAEAVVPPQCYTKHEGRFNPCYVCHQDHGGSERLNAMNDQRLQSEYDFVEVALKNHWTNLFVDRRPLIAQIEDKQILDYISRDNYSPLAGRLKQSGWQGYTPQIEDLEKAGAAFDKRGVARDGSGWVAFNYKPLPSTFWPTNGSTDDVMIRLPEAFRNDAEGNYDREIYLLNLSIAEAAIKGLSELSIPPADEKRIGVDLDGDGQLRAKVAQLKRPESYLGSAATVPVDRFLYPKGTEFLHTVRYLGLGEDGTIEATPRLKELRYMRKHTLLSPEQIRERYEDLAHEEYEDDGLSPADDQAEDHAEGDVKQAGDLGYDNGFGWYVQGFIEDARGDLRPQNTEEGLFCMGCHASVGATVDSTFAFARKVTGAPGWGYIDLHGMPDAPILGEQVGEILQYFRRVGGGDEFRENKELLKRFFGTGDSVRTDEVVSKDIYELISPSRSRALDLNKAYWTIVREQSFLRGRDANLAPMQNVYKRVDPKTAPTLPKSNQFDSDIRLDWSSRR